MNNKCFFEEPMNNKQELVDEVNELLNKCDLKIQPYRKYVTITGKNVKFLLKILNKIKDSKYNELLNLLKRLSHM